MKLILGGMAQGKLSYAMKKYDIHENQIVDGRKASYEELSDAVCIDKLHEYFRKTPDAPVPAFRDDAVIICDEVGLGVVPLDENERRFREAVGNACCQIAEKAETVERIYCGIPQRIK